MDDFERDPAMIRAAATSIQSLQWYYRCTVFPGFCALFVLLPLCMFGEPRSWVSVVPLSLVIVVFAYGLVLTTAMRWARCPRCNGWYFDVYTSRRGEGWQWGERVRCHTCGAALTDMLHGSPTSECEP